MAIDQSVGHKNDGIGGKDADNQAEQAQQYNQGTEKAEAEQLPHCAFGGASAGFDGLNRAEAFVDDKILTQAVPYRQVNRYDTADHNNGHTNDKQGRVFGDTRYHKNGRDDNQKQAGHCNKGVENSSAHISPEATLKVKQSSEGRFTSIAEAKSYLDKAYVDNDADDPAGYSGDKTYQRDHNRRSGQVPNDLIEPTGRHFYQSCDKGYADKEPEIGGHYIPAESEDVADNESFAGHNCPFQRVDV